MNVNFCTLFLRACLFNVFEFLNSLIRPLQLIKKTKGLLKPLNLTPYTKGNRWVSLRSFRPSPIIDTTPGGPRRQVQTVLLADGSQ